MCICFHALAQQSRTRVMEECAECAAAVEYSFSSSRSAEPYLGIGKGLTTVPLE